MMRRLKVVANTPHAIRIYYAGLCTEKAVQMLDEVPDSELMSCEAMEWELKLLIWSDKRIERNGKVSKQQAEVQTFTMG